MKNVHDVIVIGAGPIGIAAAAQLLSRGLQPLVLEKGTSAGSAMLEWGHVRVFTPWSYMIDETVASILQKNGWHYPDKEYLPTGREIVEGYLHPASQTPELASVIIYSAEVTAVSRENHSKHTSSDRDSALYTVHYKDGVGNTHIEYAKSIIDASGTWSTPNPIGLDGLAVPGEVENRDLITYGIPDVLDSERDGYEGKKTLVLGAGHSAMNIVMALLKLQKDAPQTRIVWGLRKSNIDKLLGNGINDKVPARKELGLAAKHAIDSNALQLITQIQIQRIDRVADGLRVTLLSEGEEKVLEADKIVVTTGFRPDLQMLREIRLDIDPIVEAPSALAPMIDPNLHSCGSVKAHGVEELSHFDKGFYMVGMKSYGRAPTFLALTGYEQVRSIADELAGNHEAARQVAVQFPSSLGSSGATAESIVSCCN
ncbi:NAD(P)-binding domain-containing protein [Microbulbifer sp. VAAC004]|uniref:NAD(P)-binding domain-containing protein n=1 Tax=unclassified Microbulbifer TaxID=2619833 RepID=UPI004039E47B